MKKVLDKIGEIINNDFGNFEGNDIKLIETDVDSTTKDISIKKKGKLFIAKFDKKSQKDKDYFPYFSNIKYLRKVSDYVLFYINNKKLFVFICELKSKNGKNSGKQVEASYVFSKYLISTVSRMLNYMDFEVEYRALIFSHKGTKKGKTKPSNKNIYDTYPNSKLKWTHLKDGEKYNLDNYCF